MARSTGAPLVSALENGLYCRCYLGLIIFLHISERRACAALGQHHSTHHLRLRSVRMGCPQTPCRGGSTGRAPSGSSSPGPPWMVAVLVKMLVALSSSSPLSQR